MYKTDNTISVTKAILNTPPFIEKSITVAMMITNHGVCEINGLNLTDNYDIQGKYSPDEKGAVLFYKGRRHRIETKSHKNKITLKGIFVPPRESVYVFFSWRI